MSTKIEITPTSGGGGGDTDLNYISAPNKGTVTSSTGTSAEIPITDSTNAGLFTAAEKTKLAGIQANAEVNVNADWNAVSGDAQILNKPTLNTGTVTSVGITAGAGISLTGTNPITSSGTITVTNSAPDIPVSITQGTGISVTGVYPTFNISATGISSASVLQHQVKYGEQINKGQAAYVSSADGTNMIVSKADNTTDALSSKTLGLITETGNNNHIGFILTEGLLAGLNTSSATIGDPVWLGNNGNLIYGSANKPYAPLHIVFVGVVTRVNINNGEIFVKVQNGFELDELHNVQAQNPSLNDTLWYDSSVTPGQWKTASINTILGYTPENVTNKRITFQATPTDTAYPSEKLVKDNLNLKADLASPTFTGTPTLPTGTIGYTQTTGDNTTKLATTAFVNASIEPSGTILSTTRALPFKMATSINTYRSASGVGSTTISSTTFAGESTHYYPISLKEGSPVRAAAFRVNTAGSGGLGTADIEVGIYNATTNANGELIPGTLEVQFGKVSVLSTGIKEAVLASPYTLGATVDNIYFIAFRSYSTNSISLNIYSTSDVLSSWIGISSSTALVKLGMFIATTPYTAPTGLPASLPVTGGVGFTQSATVAGYTVNQLLIGLR